MLEIYQRLGLHCHETVDVVVALTHEQRDRGRLKLTGTQGEDVRIFLDRGTPLRIGECLKSECGHIVQIAGLTEPVVRASCEDWVLFAKACYHLGNRHTKVEIGDRWLRILPDHVLEDMLKNLGLTVTEEQQIFNPENGAYAHGRHAH